MTPATESTCAHLFNIMDAAGRWRCENCGEFRANGPSAKVAMAEQAVIAAAMAWYRAPEFGDDEAKWHLAGACADLEAKLCETVAPIPGHSAIAEARNQSAEGQS